MIPVSKINEKVILNDSGFVQQWDFSRANMSYESRVNAVTQCASICYQSPKALDSISLFNRLQAESGGLPSSSYEFVPILLKNANTFDDLYSKCEESKTYVSQMPNFIKYGTVIENGDYFLTNLRALLEDIGEEESKNYFNTSEEEIAIIARNFKVFLYNIDVPTRTQMIRHRINWQELSRRYLSGKKNAFSFYSSDKIKNFEFTATAEFGDGEFSAQNYFDLAVSMYDQLIEAKVKPEEARRIIPQAMMTQIWGAYQPYQLEAFTKLRSDAHAQKEVRQVSETMTELLGESHVQ